MDIVAHKTPPEAGASLRVRDLHVSFDSDQGRIFAVNGVDLDVAPGETLALVGESGSGKSVTSEAVMGIVDCPPGQVSAREMMWGGRSLTQMTRTERRKLCGRTFSLVFQDALTALNPGFTVGYQIAEMFRVHQGLSKRQAREKAIESLRRVGIPAPERRVDEYPHQYSGGMRQRAMIAIAIALRPKLLFADEPTTALDVTVQAQVIELIKQIQREDGMSLVLVSHDLDLVAQYCDRIAVMYAGRIVETGTVDQVYLNPAHPYTRGLISSRPTLHSDQGVLSTIPGLPPRLTALPEGCAFEPRCTMSTDLCQRAVPGEVRLAPGHLSRCHFAGQVEHERAAS
ncbi:ABC transporter ATP-binding protein [Paracoccus liaowanqingii]|uniref:ABC transporter ATP-binding protein n=1 Tax=Paracoccus liaowanqingii TaxID=2560053 RepID=A0A4Z1CRC0_9RHOB|nr:ABC transporter ATP-binding protein [Paracoccus liaowanqingii]TGN67755.1 ABC transporter ATP-binding protein [Paracoccus liaowanqingii]